MHRRLVLAVILTALLATAASAAPRRRPVRSPEPWNAPRCSEVAGFPAVSLSVDGGASVLPHRDGGVEGLQIATFGVAAEEVAEPAHRRHRPHPALLT